MITVSNFKFVLENILGFTLSENEIYIKHFDTVDCDLKVDFNNKKLIYPTYSDYINHEYFGQYVKEYEQSSDYKTALKQDERLKSKDGTEHLENRNKAFYNYVLAIEKDKVYCFALVYKQIVLVVTAPIDDKDQEKFLGYTWSNRKGDEGIKIKSSNPQKSCGLLYNVYDEENSIARFVKDSFLDIYRNGTDSGDSVISKYIVANSLKDMIDFSRTTFDKSIKTNVQGESGKFKIESKYPLVKLEDYVIVNPSKEEIKNISDNTLVSFVEMASVTNNGFIEIKIDKPLGELRKGSYTNFAEDDIIVAKITPCMENGKCALATGLTNKIGMGSSEFHVFRSSDKILNKYLFALLNRENVRKIAALNMTGASGHRRVPENFYKEMQIPLPPIDIQKSIVAECEQVDSEYQVAQQSIDKYKNQISEIVENVKGEKKRLGDIAPYGTGRIAYKENQSESYISTDNLLQNCEGVKIY